MKKLLTLFLCYVSLVLCLKLNAQTTFKIYNNEMFYGGYSSLSDQAKDTVVTTPAGDGVTRLKTSLITKKITDEQLATIGSKLSAKVLVRAACDNYDRGAHLNLVFVKKGDTTYAKPGSTTAVKRLELGRFITPFMNKNIAPDTVPYVFELNNIAMILKDKKVRDSFDIWCELEIFGVSSTAWNEVSGCGYGAKDGNGKYTNGRKDVFYGTLDFTTSGETTLETNNIWLPVANQFSLNMNKANQSDVIGEPAKTFTYTLPAKSYFTRVFLIVSSHGAGSGGEEYNRRTHYAYADGTLINEFKQGLGTCEPYRKYNTQSNGIYQGSRSDASWEATANWCPGAIVPTFVFNLGTLEAGQHTFKLEVPDAQFSNTDDKIQTSVYVLGKDEPFTGLNDVDAVLSTASLYPNPANDMISILSDNEIKQLNVFNALGKNVWQGISPNINVAALETGLYYVRVAFENGQYTVKPFIKK